MVDSELRSLFAYIIRHRNTLACACFAMWGAGLALGTERFGFAWGVLTVLFSLFFFKLGRWVHDGQ